MSVWIVLAVYGVGYVIAWWKFANGWMDNFGGRYRAKYEEVQAAGWAMIAALFWPALALPFAASFLLKRARRNR